MSETDVIKKRKRLIISWSIVYIIIVPVIIFGALFVFLLSLAD